MKKYLKILSTIFLLLPLWGQGGIFAQNYPVQCTPILTPPYSLSWVEYGSSPERLKVQLLLNAFEPNPQRNFHARFGQVFEE